ncbi:hypothetical protein F2Q69_00047543 [Brassica cretica]|uniref:Uncharacterized protein n=1 Tax=Brassica cretica TaxID=69181 RepID=A0A8S9PUH0_BRACR|nr:hypothetical protein F2Q69_00047543 [Brassica cretica]
MKTKDQIHNNSEEDSHDKSSRKVTQGLGKRILDNKTPIVQLAYWASWIRKAIQLTEQASWIGKVVQLAERASLTDHAVQLAERASLTDHAVQLACSASWIDQPAFFPSS